MIGMALMIDMIALAGAAIDPDLGFRVRLRVLIKHGKMREKPRGSGEKSERKAEMFQMCGKRSEGNALIHRRSKKKSERKMFRVCGKRREGKAHIQRGSEKRSK